MEATAKKKKDAKNLAFKMMAVKLGEILRLLKPQPGISAGFFLALAMIAGFIHE